MATIGLDQGLRFLLITALFISTAKVLIIIARRVRIKLCERHINRRKSIYTALYSGLNPQKISFEYRQSQGIKDDNFIYGETLFTPFAELLYIAAPRAGDIFYDIGCGAGKTVFTVAALYDELEIHGIEILPPLYETCERLLDQYHTLPGIYKSTSIEFHQADFLEYDFSNGTLVFVNATCIDRMTWAKLVKRLERLPKGARVLVSTKTINSKLFEEQFIGTTLMSWGHSSVRIYRKTRDA